MAKQETGKDGANWAPIFTPIPEEPKVFRLCYIEGQTAWFTTLPVSAQSGGGWTRRSYEHVAEDPDEGDGYELKQIMFQSELYSPQEKSLNSELSVYDINEKKVPWLEGLHSNDKPVKIYAGIPILEFVDIILKTGGMVYHSNVDLKKMHLEMSNAMHQDTQSTRSPPVEYEPTPLCSDRP